VQIVGVATTRPATAQKAAAEQSAKAGGWVTVEKVIE